MKFENAPGLSSQNQSKKLENVPVQSSQEKNQLENSEGNGSINWLKKKYLNRLYASGLISLALFEAASAQAQSSFGRKIIEPYRQAKYQEYKEKIKAEGDERRRQEKEKSISYDNAVTLINETKGKFLKYDQLPQKPGAPKLIKEKKENSEEKSSSLKVGNLVFTNITGKTSDYAVNGIDWAEKDTKGKKRTICLQELGDRSLKKDKQVELYDFHGDTLNTYTIDVKEGSGKHEVSFKSILTDPKYKGAEGTVKMTKVLNEITPESSWQDIKKCLEELDKIVKELDEKIDKKLP